MKKSSLLKMKNLPATEEMLAVAREDVPDDVAAAYQGNRPRFGPQYIIPVPFDPRLISAIPVAVARAAPGLRQRSLPACVARSRGCAAASVAQQP